METKAKLAAEKTLNQVKIGQTIEKFLLAKGLTQAKLALSSGITPGYLSQIIDGSKVPAIDKLEALCGQLGVPLFVFLMEASIDSLPTRENKTTVLDHIAPMFQKLTHELYLEDKAVAIK